MSYWCKIGFKTIKDEDLMLEIQKVKKLYKKNSEDILKLNKYYIPSIKYGDIGAEIEDKINSRRLNKYWIYKALQFSVMYWKDKGLLGIVGELELKDYDYVIFQNSCDQDYEYSEWPKQAYFNQILWYYKNLSNDELQQKLGYILEDKTYEEVEYARKSLIYQAIYDGLGIGERLDKGESDSFIRLDISTVESITEFYELQRIVQRLCNEIEREEANE